MAKFKTEEIISKFKEVHGERYDYSLVEYVHSEQKVKIICRTHGIFEQTAYNHIHGSNCLLCSRIYKTTEEFILEAKEVHGNNYIYDLVNYKNAKEKISLVCKRCEKEFKISPLIGQGCLSCNVSEGIQQKNSIYLKEFIEASKKRYGDKYDYSQIKKYSSKKKLEIVCKDHGSFFVVSSVHLSGQECQKCRKIKEEEKKSSKNYLSLKDKNLLSNIKRQKEYIYPDLSFKKKNDFVNLFCERHGEFSLKLFKLIKEHKCPFCVNEERLLDFIKKIDTKYPNHFLDFSSSIYIGIKDKIRVKCKLHNIEVEDRAENLLRNSPCPLCKKNQKLSNQEFIEKCLSIHDNKYDYSKTFFSKFQEKIIVKCAFHGYFSINAAKHYFSKEGCALCSKSGFKKDKIGYLYYIRINKDGEEVYKIGITNQTIKERFRKEFKYITVIRVYEYEKGEEAYNLEQKILKEYSYAKYKGDLKLNNGGLTECFSYDILNWD